MEKYTEKFNEACRIAEKNVLAEKDAEIERLTAEMRQKDAVIEAATNLVRAEGWQIERDNLWDTLHELIDDLDTASDKHKK